ncbi:hypothetical protein JYU34_010472 [Plutella xylostella]|uniref:FP protein C-terminal domain-containing protein n=1 Tax=Plutella xylostella TaxID=51655 RepID=A0ABQ7QJR0_PLUXY|nr:hypothetical protein JYU34_010472 [Plutella xylostella]
MDCIKCHDKCKVEELLKCTQCQMINHYWCYGMSEVDYKKILPMNKPKWKCLECKTKKPINPRVNSDGIQGQLTNVDTTSLMQYMDTKFEALSVNLTEFKSSVISQLADLTKLVDSFEQRIQCLEKKSTDYSECPALIKQNLEVASLNDTISSLREQLNSQEQFGLRNEMEISGITENDNESLYHIVSLAAAKVGVAMEENDIDMITRVGPRRTRENQEPRPVVVRFLRNAKRNEMLNATKSRNRLSSDDIEVKGARRNLYFNERLTKANRKLFRDARIRTKQHGFRYCWVKNGLIYVRKEDQKPPKLINNSDDIDRLIGPLRPDPPVPVSTHSENNM